MLELLGFVETACIVKTEKGVIPVDVDNMHLSIIDDNLDENNWLEIYGVWYQVLFDSQ